MVFGLLPSRNDSVTPIPEQDRALREPHEYVNTLRDHRQDVPDLTRFDARNLAREPSAEVREIWRAGDRIG